MDMARTFVAVELPQQVKDGLTGIQQDLKRAGNDVVRWVMAEGMHLTIKFLGEIPVDMVSQVDAALKEAAAGIPPFGLETAELGFFPNATSPRVFWIDLKGNVPALLRLQENVELALDALGFRREARGFSPHLTLARFRDTALPERRKAFGEEVVHRKVPASWAFTVDGINLVKSTPTSGGVIYARLTRVPLKG